jgi:hypothetical protein
VEGDRTDPIVMTTVTDPSLMADLLRGLRATGEVPLAVATTPDELAAVDGSSEIVAYVGGDLLAFSTSPAVLSEVVSAPDTVSGFTTTEFHAAILDAYSGGVDWLFAADLDRVVVESGVESGAHTAVTGFLGFDRLDDLLVEYKTVAGSPQTRAAMTFSQERTGLASWIREAGPMGSIEFVSPEAVFVAGGLTRDAEAVVQEILGLIERTSADAWTQIEEFQREHRFDLEYDFASTFGGEFIVAIDGPVLPTPSWKLVAEVYNSAILQNTIDRLVFEVNRVAVPAGHEPLGIEAETVGGQIYYALHFGPETAIHYTFSGGYMVAGPNRTLVAQALQYQQARLSLASSSAFRDMMPAGSENHCSALAYQNIGSALSGFESWLATVNDVNGVNVGNDANGAGADGEEALSLLAAFTALDRPPTLVCVVATADRVVAMNEGESPFAWLEIGGASILSELMAGESNR